MPNFDKPNIAHVFNMFKSTIIMIMRLSFNSPVLSFRSRSRGGGYSELFFDGVCGPRFETPTHIKEFFSLKKRLNR